MGEGDVPPSALGADGLESPLEGGGLSGFLHRTLPPVHHHYGFLLTDKAGRPIRNYDGRMIEVPPHVTLGEIIAFGKRGRGKLPWEQAKLLGNFRQYGPMDYQRLGHTYHPKYVDFSTVAIGLAAAAMGLPVSDILAAEEGYGLTHSMRGWRHAKKNLIWWPLPERNVYNTKLGYRLYQSNDAKIIWAQIEDPPAS